MINKHKKYLENVFEITPRQFFHARDIISKAPNGTTTKGCNHTKPGMVSAMLIIIYNDSPFIEGLNTVISLGMKHPKKVGENCLPHTKFKLMKEVHNKH